MENLNGVDFDVNALRKLTEQNKQQMTSAQCQAIKQSIINEMTDIAKSGRNELYYNIKHGLSKEIIDKLVLYFRNDKQLICEHQQDDGCPMEMLDYGYNRLHIKW